MENRYREKTIPWERFMELAENLPSVPGTAVYMTSSLENTPPALVENTRRNHVLHQRVILLNVTTAEVPRVSPSDRLEIEPLSNGFFRIAARYGFSESPSVPDLLKVAAEKGIDVDFNETTFFLAARRCSPRSAPGMAI